MLNPNREDADVLLFALLVINCKIIKEMFTSCCYCMFSTGLYLEKALDRKKIYVYLLLHGIAELLF